MIELLEIYKGKKVFVTGHTGFKGSWLCLWLNFLGADVCGYALKPNTNPSIFNILGLKNKIKHIEGNICDFEKLNREISSFCPEIVFHLAAQPLVRVSYKEPAETYRTNIMGIVNVLESVRRNSSIKAVINVTTDKCYKNQEKGHCFKEEDELCGHDPYSNSKSCSELVTSSYRDSFFNTQNFETNHNTLVATARAGNVIGGGDYSLDRLVPDFVKAIENNKSTVLRNPNSIRPWQFVLEPLYGYLLLGKELLDGKIECSSPYNFGPEEESIVTVEKVVQESILVWGKGSIVIDNNEQPHEAKLLKLDISKAKKELSWRPVYCVKKAIKETISWYKAYHDNVDMPNFSLNQIIEYSKKVQTKQ